LNSPTLPETTPMRFPLSSTLGEGLIVSTAGYLFVLALLSVLGGAIGSFMNVVVYRLPRMVSLVRPGSRCPRCEHPIRWHDNVPILGWLILGGRCRDCGAPISPRYPLVEALLAAGSGLLAWKAAAPQIAAPRNYWDNLYLIDLPAYIFTMLLVCTLLCAALVEFDGRVPPKRLFLPLFVGLAMLAVRPSLASPAELFSSVGLPVIGGLVAATLGMFAALMIGAGPWLTWLVNARSSRLAQATAALASLVLVGAFAGDHAVITIGLESMVLYTTTQLLARKWPAVGRFGWAGPLALLTIVWELTWPDEWLPDPQISSEPWIRLVFAAAITSLLAIVLQIVPRRASASRQF
jgi:prepilin signal peptidase PulO-like enzyme (type II secretory pathway)